MALEHPPSASAQHANPAASAAVEAGAVAPEIPASAGLLKLPEAAAYLDLGISTFLRRVRAGEIPAYALGRRSVRYRRADLDAYIAGMRISSDAKEAA